MQQTEILIKAMRRAAEKMHTLKIQELSNIGMSDLSIASFKYIETIHHLGNPTFIELATALDLSKPSVTLMVNKLVRKGIIQKTQSETDKRSYYLSLTAQGNRIMDTYFEIQKQFVEHLSTVFNHEEIDSLILMLNRI